MNTHTNTVDIGEIIKNMNKQMTELNEAEIAAIVADALWKNKPKMEPEELAVVELIEKHGCISQGAIAKQERWLGSHPSHEKFSRNTSTRKVRLIISNLINKHGIPICSCQNGFFFPVTWANICDELAMREGRARAYLRTALETRTAFSNAFKVEFAPAAMDVGDWTESVNHQPTKEEGQCEVCYLSEELL